MSSNPINVKINNFDMNNGMNATFNINGKDFDINISSDDINKYFSSNTNIPIANIIPNDESSNNDGFKGTFAVDTDEPDSNIHPEDENAIDNAAEKIFENNRNDGNKILTGLMSNLLEELKKDSRLTTENKNTIEEFMNNPTHFRHSGGGNINWINNDNYTIQFDKSFDTAMLAIKTDKITVKQRPDFIGNKKTKVTSDYDIIRRKFNQFLINAAFIQKYHEQNKDNFDMYNTNLKMWKHAEYDKLDPQDDTSVSYIFSALSRVLCYDDRLTTIDSLSDIVSYTGDITKFKNRYEFHEEQVNEEYNNLVVEFGDNIIQQDTKRNKTLRTNKDTCPTENLLAIDLLTGDTDNDNNDGNNVDWWDESDGLDEDGKSTLPIKNIKDIIKNTENQQLKDDFKVLYRQYIVIRSALKSIDRAISTVRDEIPKMKNIIEEESKRDTANKTRLDKRKKRLNDKLTEERKNIEAEDKKLNMAIGALEKHENDEIVDGNIIDNIKQYRTTYIVELFKLYKEFESISQPNKSWFSGLNYFHRKTDEQTPGRFSGFMRAIGNVFKRRDARIAPSGGKQNRTKRLKEPRNKSLKKRNH